MRDGAEDIDSERTKLEYPFVRGPVTGEAIEIAPGALWMRMPTTEADTINADLLAFF